MNFDREFLPARVGEGVARCRPNGDDSETMQIKTLGHGLLDASKAQAGILVLRCKREQKLAGRGNGRVLNSRNTRSKKPVAYPAANGDDAIVVSEFLEIKGKIRSVFGRLKVRVAVADTGRNTE